MDAKTLEELKAKSAQALGARKEDVVVAHVTMTPEPCDHDWGDSEGNPERCIKCGMSFTRYIFTECL